MTDPLSRSLAAWGLSGASCTFVAGRENRVWRVRSPEGDLALRIRRPGYRRAEELRSELVWLEAMHDAGLRVPRPVRSRSGAFLEEVDAVFVDVVTWLPGRPLGTSRDPLDLDDAPGAFRRIGTEIARLHQACDAWRPPAGFVRGVWDVDGLLGDAPHWGRFWENPALDRGTRELFLRFRRFAGARLAREAERLDRGLIHADLVRENVLLDGPDVALIDFDDGGYGYRQFDLATVLLKNAGEPEYPALRRALLEGYASRRQLDVGLLDLFVALRALTYVGWIVPRIGEDGGVERNARFVADARRLCLSFEDAAVGLQGEP